MPTTRSEPGSRPAASALAGIALALLVLAAFAALLIAQHRKDHKALVGAGVWSPSHGPLDPRTQTASFSFIAYYTDELTISIVSERSGRTVLVRARDYPLHGWDRSRTFYWNGRTASGGLAPPGDYEVAVHFRRLDRTPLVPNVYFDIGRRS